MKLIPLREGGRRFRPVNPAPQRLNSQVFLLSILVIAGFFYFEKIAGLVPCELCLKERLPWYAGLALSIIFLPWHPRSLMRFLPVVFFLLFSGSAALAAYHVMVEQHWVAGPSACTASSSAGESLEELKRRILATAPVHCDEVQWRFIGISLAGWNVVASLLVVVLALLATRRGERTL